MPQILVLSLFLLVTWFVLSGQATGVFLAVGVICCIASLALYKIMFKEKTVNHQVNVFALFIYILWLVKEIVKSSIDIGLRMWRLELEISPQTAWIPNDAGSDAATVLFANSITLTPGTVAIDTKKGAVMVHSLTQNSMAELKKGKMLGLVKKAIKLRKK